MAELTASPFFGVSLSVLAFWVGTRIQKKTGLTICNPLIIGIVLVIGVLLLFRIPYEDYAQGGSFLDLFLAPAPACLAGARPPLWGACTCCAGSSGWTRR